MTENSSRGNFLHYRTHGKVAILIDGGFFLKRVGFLGRPDKRNDVDYVIKLINILCAKHAQRLDQQIYRIFFYDCPPFEAGLHHPLTNEFIKFKNSSLYQFKIELFNQLRAMRKMALRLGRLSIDSASSWQIRPGKVKELLSGKITVQDLAPEDVLPSLHQKQVDIKIGVDITSMVLKKQVQTIVLVAGDGDFVPASKLARREGVDFILDPMWAQINPDLNEHVDGVQSVLFNNHGPSQTR